MSKKLRKLMAIVLSVLIVCGLLTGCGANKGNENKEINICIWDGAYSEDAIEAFEKKSGIKVNITYIDNTDTLISKVISGGSQYDVIDIEAAYVKTFVDGNLLQAVDHSSLSNEAYLLESLLTEGPIGDEDLTYVVPNQNFGYTTIIYNKETCPIEITSFQDLADPALKGEVGMVSSTISLYGAALESLGYDADSVDEGEIEAANNLLAEIKKNVKAFKGESCASLLLNGDCSVIFSWDYALLMFDSEENWDKYAVADIDSDYERFVQYWAITKDSENTEYAEEFINYMISPEATAMGVNEWGLIPMVKREYIEDYLPSGFYENPAVLKYEELADRSWLVAVDDKQIALMDTYYTLLMGGE